MVLSNIESSLSRSGYSGASEVGRFRTAASSGGMEAERKVAQTIGYMRRSLNQSLQVPKLARMANISPSHFFAVFKKRTGFAPMDFFIRLRIQRACEILDSTTLSVKEVAAQLGYEDPFYFSRVFKSVSGVAPTEYRRLSAEQKRARYGQTLIIAQQLPGAECDLAAA